MRLYRVVSKDGGLHVVDPEWDTVETYANDDAGSEKAYAYAQLLNEHRIMKRLLSKKILKQIAKEAKP